MNPSFLKKLNDEFSSRINEKCDLANVRCFNIGPDSFTPIYHWYSDIVVPNQNRKFYIDLGYDENRTVFIDAFSIDKGKYQYGTRAENRTDFDGLLKALIVCYNESKVKQ